MSELKTLFKDIKSIFKEEGVDVDVKKQKKFNKMKFEDVILEDGSVAQVEPGVEVGASVVVSVDDELLPAPDGDHLLSDGRTIKTEGGVIVEVMEAEAEEPASEEEMLDETAVEEVVEEVVADVVEEVKAEVSEATEEIAQAINEATPEEVTPEIAEQVAEVVVSIVEEKTEEVAFSKEVKLKKAFSTVRIKNALKKNNKVKSNELFNKQFSNLKSILKTENVKLKNKIEKLEVAFNGLLKLTEKLMEEPKNETVKKSKSGFSKLKNNKRDIIQTLRNKNIIN
jgi:hypothetical protein